MLKYNDKNGSPTGETCECRIIHEERIELARRQAAPETELAKLVQIFKAAADPTRLKILLALQSGEMCVCDLAAFLKLSESAVSHQLRLLRTLGLVENRREGPVLYYRGGKHPLMAILFEAIAIL
jgi:DNA-binding transcriptional ArsR family regulator